jgi:hypothetical protein
MPEANTRPLTDDENTAAGAATAAEGDTEGHDEGHAEGHDAGDDAGKAAEIRVPRDAAPAGAATGADDGGDAIAGSKGQDRAEGDERADGGVAEEAELIDAAEDFGDFPDEDDDRPRLTPRQARRVRAVVSGIVMVAVAVALAVRLSSVPSVLTVGFYGFALILSGTAIVLSRRGRTRVATGVLVLGFGAVGMAEWFLATAA